MDAALRPPTSSRRRRGPWERTVTRALRWGILAISLGQFWIGMDTLLSSVRVDSGHVALGLGLIVVQQGYQISSLWLRQNALMVTAISLALLIGGCWLLLAHVTNDHQLAQRWFVTPFSVTTLSCLALLRKRRRWNAIIALVAANLLLHYAYWPGPAPGFTFTLGQTLAAEAGRLVGMGVTAVIACQMTVRSAQRADLALDLGRQARYRTALERSRAIQARDVDRFVHDEILHGLRTIAMDRSAVPTTAALTAATNLQQLLNSKPLDAMPMTTGLTARLRELAATLPIHVQVSGPNSLDLPQDVAAAFESAVREALRNVVQHAKTDRAEVKVQQLGFEITVTVTDQGIGFTIPASPTNRHGVSGSIKERMDDVEGTSRVDSISGVGTQVTLTWNPIPERQLRPGTAGQGGAGTLMKSLIWIATPLALTAPWFAIFLAGQLRWPITVTVLSFLFPIVVVTQVQRFNRVGSVPGPQAFALAAFALVTFAVAALALPSGPGNYNLLWLSLGACQALSFLSLTRPLKESMLLGVAMTAVAWTLTSQGSWLPNPDYVAAIFAPAITMALAALARHTVDQVTFQIWQAEESLARDAAGETAESDFVTALHTRLLPQRVEIAEFLKEVTADPLSPEHPWVRHKAAQLERNTRELLLSPRTELSQATAALRRVGWTVTVRSSNDLPSQPEHQLAQAIEQLGSGKVTPGAVTLTATDQGDSWRGSLLVTQPSSYDVTALHDWVATLNSLDWNTQIKSGEVHAVRKLTSGVQQKLDSSRIA